jgi:hypothetical protein
MYLQFMAFSMGYSSGYIKVNVNAFKIYDGDQWSSNCYLQVNRILKEIKDNHPYKKQGFGKESL